MDDERYALLMREDAAALTPEEIASGWHFCPEFDGLLVGPEMGELEHCPCDSPAIDALRLRWMTEVCRG